MPKANLKPKSGASLPPRNGSALAAAKEMDWGQVVLNGRPPCFHLCEDGRFCGRAQRWQGHDDMHNFVSLADLIRDTERMNWLEANPDKITNCTWVNFNLGRLFNFSHGKTLGECAKTLRDALDEEIEAQNDKIQP